MTEYREIESKLLVYAPLESCNNLLAHLLAKRKQKLIYGYSRDTYWHTQTPAMFTRVRERDGIIQVTVKNEDKNGHFNRLEIDLNCTSPLEAVIAHHTAIFGEPAGVVEKTYYVYWIDDKTTVCVYQCTVDGQLKPELILEVEGPEEQGVQELTDEIKKFFEIGSVRIENAPGSLYTMYLRKT